MTNSDNAADSDVTEAAPNTQSAAVVFEDIHEHPVTFAPADSSPVVAESFDCHSRRWYREGTDGLAGHTVLLIPGIGHNVNFFGPLAARLLDPERGVGGISQVVSVDLPAHGGSQIPPHIKFGQLSLRNYVDTIMQVLDDLREKGKIERVDILSGHSMGGMLAMMVEQSHVDRGVTMNSEWGTSGVVLLAAALPEGVEWRLVDGFVERGVIGPVLAKLTPYLTTNLRYGLFVCASNEDYLLQFYSIDGENVSTAPTLIEATSINGIESFAAARELTGLDLKTGKKLT
ncbi:MAG TPA: alpha/beta fold hydrolase, partial [Pyrinomonadaceae bacterium]|nr:alpha/beta fold hydrolase [Pyrinomonadaceae bacterium]